MAPSPRSVSASAPTDRCRPFDAFRARVTPIHRHAVATARAARSYRRGSCGASPSAARRAARGGARHARHRRNRAAGRATVAAAGRTVPTVRRGRGRRLNAAHRSTTPAAPRRCPGKCVRDEGAAATPRRRRQRGVRRARRDVRLLLRGAYRPQLDRRRGAAPRRAACTTAAKYDNAFWNGQQMVFGDGDGDLFNRFTHRARRDRRTSSRTASPATRPDLVYLGQSGALNESISDVFGIARQAVRARQETAADADWLIGAGLFTAQGPRRRAALDEGARHGVTTIRCSARDDAAGDDDRTTCRRPPTTAACTSTPASRTTRSISPRSRLGGHAWEKAGRIWYETLRDKRAAQTATFAQFARSARSPTRTSTVRRRARARRWPRRGARSGCKAT